MKRRNGKHFIERNHMELSSRYRWTYWYWINSPRKGRCSMPHSGKGWVPREKAEACKYAPQPAAKQWAGV